MIRRMMSDAKRTGSGRQCLFSSVIIVVIKDVVMKSEITRTPEINSIRHDYNTIHLKTREKLTTTAQKSLEMRSCHGNAQPRNAKTREQNEGKIEKRDKKHSSGNL